jgi:cobalt-zinc-cadmium efflux system outer membrane protein
MAWQVEMIMKTIRFDYIAGFIIFCGSPWLTDAAEPRKVSLRSKEARSTANVVQVKSEELPAPAPTNADPEPPAIESSPDPVSTKTWTLMELEAIADEIHPALQRDRARIDAARGDALQAGLYPNPRFDSNNPQVFNGQNSLFNAGIMQEVVVKGKKRLERAAATKIVQQTEFAYVQDRFALRAAIRQQYYVVLAAERRFKVLQKLQEISASSLATGKVLEEPAGQLAHIDILILELDNQRVQSDLESSVRLLKGARNQLAAIVGDPSISFDHFEGSLYSTPPQYDEAILNEFSTSNSAYVQIAKLDVERNEILLKRAVAEPYPNVTLGPAYQWGLVQGGQQYWLTVTFPIPAWDRNQGGIHAAHADLAGSRKNVEAVQLEQLRKVAEAYSRHRAVRAQAAKYRKEIIPNAMNTLNLARKGFAAGEYDFIRYLQVQRTVIEANMAYIDLLENVWRSAAELSGLLQLENFD